MIESDYMGKEVNVAIDRPLGSKHPEFDMIYELNYGFVPNTVSGDGEEIDVYVIGEDKPLQEFTGMVKAVIIRHDDHENKLVVTHPDYEFTKQEIEQKTRFQEQYFDIEILM